MPTTQELKRAHKALDAQIVEAKWEERGAEEAWLRAEEEARMATEQAQREEEEREWEHVCLAEEARVQAEEEAQGGGEACSGAEPQGGGGVF